MDTNSQNLTEFISSVDGLINGKFILADIKITNILKLIASNSSLYEYIKNCLVDFSFDEELAKSLSRNKENNGVFVMPKEDNKKVAFVFCFLVECDAKRMDFFTFMRENFAAKDNKTDYENFAETVLVPFKDCIVNYFNNQSAEIEETEKAQDIYSILTEHLNTMLDNIILDRRIKSSEKENLEYIIKNIKYSMKYKDLNIVNAFISVLDILADKYACLRLPLKDVKSSLLNYYKNKQSE